MSQGKTTRKLIEEIDTITNQDLARAQPKSILKQTLSTHSNEDETAPGGPGDSSSRQSHIPIWRWSTDGDRIRVDIQVPGMVSYPRTLLKIQE
jgi:hypothetical protein